MKTKYIKMTGFAFDEKWVTNMFSIKWGEEADMEKLADESKNGWIVTGIKGMSYVLIQGEPDELIYSIG